MNEDVEELVRAVRERARMSPPVPKARKAANPRQKVFRCRLCGEIISRLDSYMDLGAGQRGHITCPKDT